MQDTFDLAGREAAQMSRERIQIERCSRPKRGSTKLRPAEAAIQDVRDEHAGETQLRLVSREMSPPSREESVVDAVQATSFFP